VDTKSETSHTANDISRKVKKHVSWKPIRRMGIYGSLCRQCAPPLISKRFAVALSRVDHQKKVSKALNLSLWSTTNRLRPIGSQFNSFCLNM
jgi:hypothetical protein